MTGSLTVAALMGVVGMDSQRWVHDSLGEPIPHPFF